MIIHVYKHLYNKEITVSKAVFVTDKSKLNSKNIQYTIRVVQSCLKILVAFCEIFNSVSILFFLMFK